MNELATLLAQYGTDTFLQHTHALIALIEKDGKLSAWNPALGSLVEKISPNHILPDFLSQESRETYLVLVNSARENQISGRENLDFITNQENNHARYDCMMVSLPGGRMLLFGEEAIDVSEINQKNLKLSELVAKFEAENNGLRKSLVNKQTEIDAVIAQANEVSHIDALTYLSNRRQIIKDLQHEVIRADRYRTPLSISMMDLDHFKNINDTYGHAIGDDILRQIANHLREHIRLPDLVGRYGGEEFLILLPNSDVKAASEQAARLCQQIRASRLTANGQLIHMTISLGLAEYSIGAESWQKLLNRADAALYQAKNKGRDTWATADS